jgi:hypothetical protein
MPRLHIFVPPAQVINIEFGIRNTVFGCLFMQATSGTEITGP